MPHTEERRPRRVKLIGRRFTQVDSDNMLNGTAGRRYLRLPMLPHRLNEDQNPWANRGVFTQGYCPHSSQPLLPINEMHLQKSVQKKQGPAGVNVMNLFGKSVLLFF